MYENIIFYNLKIWSGWRKTEAIDDVVYYFLFSSCLRAISQKGAVCRDKIALRHDEFDALSTCKSHRARVRAIFFYKRLVRLSCRPGLTSTSIGGQTNLKKEEKRKLYRTVSLLLLLNGNLKLINLKYTRVHYRNNTTSRTLTTFFDIIHYYHVSQETMIQSSMILSTKQAPPSATRLPETVQHLLYSAFSALWLSRFLLSVESIVLSPPSQRRYQ